MVRGASVARYLYRLTWVQGFKDVVRPEAPVCLGPGMSSPSLGGSFRGGHGGLGCSPDSHPVQNCRRQAGVQDWPPARILVPAARNLLRLFAPVCNPVQFPSVCSRSVNSFLGGVVVRPTQTIASLMSSLVLPWLPAARRTWSWRSHSPGSPRRTGRAPLLPLLGSRLMSACA